MDPQWGHLTIKMSGHPPFGAQVMLNGHEYVACAAQATWPLRITWAPNGGWPLILIVRCPQVGSMMVPVGRRRGAC